MSADQMHRAVKTIEQNAWLEDDADRAVAALLRVIGKRAEEIGSTLVNPEARTAVIRSAITGWDEACHVAAAYLGEQVQP